uniref:Pentatricopeptide repeat-containing protein n=1 Tax=Arundo donax TaxID=35708 RepID=A0A0A9H9R2_ARUDO
MMPEPGCAPNVFTPSVILKGLCDDGRSLEAFELLRTMAGDGDETNVVSYNAVIDGHFKDGKVEDAVKLFDEMCDQGVSLDTVTTAQSSTSCARSGQ